MSDLVGPYEDRNCDTERSADPEPAPQGPTSGQFDREWRPDEHRRPVGLTSMSACALRNACREFCSALLMSGLESIGCTKGRQRLARVSQRSVRDPPMLPSYWLDGPRLMASKTAAMTGSRLAK